MVLSCGNSRLHEAHAAWHFLLKAQARYLRNTDNQQQ